MYLIVFYIFFLLVFWSFLFFQPFVTLFFSFPKFINDLFPTRITFAKLYVSKVTNRYLLAFNFNGPQTNLNLNLSKKLSRF